MICSTVLMWRSNGKHVLHIAACEPHMCTCCSMEMPWIQAHFARTPTRIIYIYIFIKNISWPFLHRDACNLLKGLFFAWCCSVRWSRPRKTSCQNEKEQEAETSGRSVCSTEYCRSGIWWSGRRKWWASTLPWLTSRLVIITVIALLRSYRSTNTNVLGGTTSPVCACTPTSPPYLVRAICLSNGTVMDDGFNILNMYLILLRIAALLYKIGKERLFICGKNKGTHASTHWCMPCMIRTTNPCQHINKLSFYYW